MSVLVASNPSTSYIATSSSADALGGLLSCHCHETFRPGCQQPGHATGAATRTGATGRARIGAASAGSQADDSSTRQSRDGTASRSLTERVSAAARGDLDLTGPR